MKSSMHGTNCQQLKDKRVQLVGLLGAQGTLGWDESEFLSTSLPTHQNNSGSQKLNKCNN